MKFKLESPVWEESPPITYGSNIVLLGSCFSNEMSTQLHQVGFSVQSNPFGTIFHPLALAQLLRLALDEERNYPIFKAEDRYYCWYTAHLLSASSEELLRQLLDEKCDVLRSQLASASHLFLTLGSSWAHHLVTDQLLVANCHKMPASFFRKELTSINDMTQVWLHTIDRLLLHNPSLTICFTVSPVRHIREGLVENNRSKARLIELVGQLEAQKGVFYYPAYEILIDELRDYRFYEADLVHPSKQAVSYIWNHFLNTFCSRKDQDLAHEVIKLRALSQHQILDPISGEGQLFLRQREQRIQDFLAANPLVIW